MIMTKTDYDDDDDDDDGDVDVVKFKTLFFLQRVPSFYTVNFPEEEKIMIGSEGETFIVLQFRFFPALDGK